MCSSLSQRLSLSRSMIKGDVETCKVACHALAFYPRRIEIIEKIEAEPGQRGQRVGFAIQRSRVRLVSTTLLPRRLRRRLAFALTTTYVCFTVALSPNPRPRLQIANWFSSGQLGFVAMLCSVRIICFSQLFSRPH